MAIEVGQKNKKEMVVEENHCVSPAGYSDFKVLSTPSMIMLMEETCNESMAPCLDEGYASVGVHVDVYHTSSTFVGEKVWAESEVTAVEGRKATFKITAFDEGGEIGHGTHERSTINLKKMMG